MKTKYIYAVLWAGIFTVFSCIDDKEYHAQIPQDPSIEEPKEYALAIDPNKIFVHPGCMVAQEDFDRAKRHIGVGDEPWAGAFNVLKGGKFFRRTNDDMRIKRDGSGLYKGYLLRGSANKRYWCEELNEYIYRKAGNFDVEYQDCSMAYSKAVYWKLTGETRYADEAVEVLNTYAQLCKGITGDENKALCYMESGYDFASIAELLREYPGWKAEDQQVFKDWLLTVYEQKLVDFLDKHDSSAATTGSTHYWSNWDLGHMLALMAIGVYCDRPDLYNKAISYVTYGSGNGNFRRFINYIHPATSGEDDIDLGQTQEAGRDQGHNLLSIRLGAAICRIAWNQGDDLYGYDNNRFLKGAELVAKYNYGPKIEEQQGLAASLTYPFHAGIMNSDGNYHADYSPADRGQFCSGFVSIYEHYRTHKRISTRYVRWAAKTPGQNDLEADTTKVVLIEPETYNHNQGAGSSHGTLLFTEDESILRK